MTSLGRGVLKELRLAQRALKVARAHLSQARCGLKGWADEEGLSLAIDLEEAINRVSKIALVRDVEKSRALKGKAMRRVAARRAA